MIQYDDLIDTALVETGQFITGIEATMLNQDKLELLIKRELQWYSRYYPIRKRKQIAIDSSRVYEFKTDIPKTVTSIVRESSGTSQRMFGYNVTHKPRFQYSDGVLEIESGFEGIYTVEYLLDHEYKNEAIETLDMQSQFVNLFIGKFMISLGRSRQAFLLNDLSFTMNGDSLASEGQELYQATKEFIYETSRYDYAIIKR